MHFRAIFAENDRSGHKIKKCSQIENSVLKIQNKNRWNSNGFMAEGTGLEPAGLLHLTRFPGELLSHSVNPPSVEVYTIDIQLLCRVFLVAAPLQSSCISSISESEIPDLALSVNPPSVEVFVFCIQFSSCRSQ